LGLGPPVSGLVEGVPGSGAERFGADEENDCSTGAKDFIEAG